MIHPIKPLTEAEVQTAMFRYYQTEDKKKSPKTLIVFAEQLVSNFRTNMMEHLYADMEFNDNKTFAQDLIQLGNDVLALLSTNNRDALNAFRNQFKYGSTMMMLDTKDFEQIEAWDKNKEEFRIVIIREDNTAIGLVEQSDINY